MLEYCSFHLTQHHLVLNAPNTGGVARHHFCCCCEAACEDEGTGARADSQCPTPCMASLEIIQEDFSYHSHLPSGVYGSVYWKSAEKQ